jgi:hypothetical protein
MEGMKTGKSKFIIYSMMTVMLAVGFIPTVLANAAALPQNGGVSVFPALPTPTMAPQATAEPVSDVQHTLIPVTGLGKEQVIHDQVNTSTASQKRAFGGDEYNVGRFERPFDKDMNFLAYLDIVKSTMQREDPNFVYMTIQVAAPISSAEGKPALYGLELDTNHDGRSEYLILAEKPLNSDWTVAGVNVWKSTSAESPITQSSPAIPVTGSLGYDVSLFAAGKGDDADLAWVRMSPDKPDTVEIAFKNTLVGGEKGGFVWRPMTDGATFETKSYDLNVNFTLEQAGSPLKDSLFYPLKEVFAVDNTCRVASGYEASGKEPGLCPLPPPPSRPDKPQPGPRNPNTQPDIFL